MNKESRSNVVLIVTLVAAGCLVLLCGAMLLVVFMFGISPFTVEETPVETTTLSAAQLEQCRELLAIQPEVELEGSKSSSRAFTASKASGSKRSRNKQGSGGAWEQWRNCFPYLPAPALRC